MSANTDLEKARLLSLIEFAQQVVRMDKEAVARVENHGLFKLYEHELYELPGIKLNLNSRDSEDELWMSIARLHKIKPSAIDNSILLPWVEVLDDPTLKPTLRAKISKEELCPHDEQMANENDSTISSKKILPDSSAFITLEEYKHADIVRTAFEDYVAGAWTLWATEEKPRRKTISLYGLLFTLQQQMQEGVVDTPVEIAWGVGIGVWNCNETSISYPLVTQLCELALNSRTAAIEIRPRELDAQLEVDWYASVDNPGVSALEKSAKDFFANATQTFSPFDRSTFEPLLKEAATHLDSNGVYLSQLEQQENRALPKPEISLKITDTWVLFARPRTNNSYLQDLDKFKKQIEAAETNAAFPGAVAAIIKDPLNVHEKISVPSYRGLSAVSGNSSDKVKDLFFPMAFNDEQVRIVQLLDVSDGVVVQGPPGTGKTHTIANVICHYLANGKRVLVTSMKEPALAVLQEKLPDEIRPLAISLLTSEADGMKQFEYAIAKIASEVPRINSVILSAEITEAERQIDRIHAHMSLIDSKVNDWAAKNLGHIELDAERIEPQDAAREVIEASDSFAYIPDALTIGAECSPKFSAADIQLIRDARRVLGQDVNYLGASLPQPVEFPSAQLLLQAHQELSKLALLSQEDLSKKLPALLDSSQESIAAIQQLEKSIQHLLLLRNEVAASGKPWVARIREHAIKSGADGIFESFEALGRELATANESRKNFLNRPIALANGLDTDREMIDALNNLAKGKLPFGLTGVVGKQKAKKKIASVRILGDAPASKADWAYVLRYILLQKQMRTLAMRWNSIAPELQIESLSGIEAEHAIHAHGLFIVYEKIRMMVRIEQYVILQASKLLPDWQHALEIASNPAALSELSKILQYHLTKHRLGCAWAIKEQFLQVLNSYTGKSVDDIRAFLKHVGNPKVTEAQIQTSWSSLMAELSRAHGLEQQLKVIQQVSAIIADSGAPKYAELLKKPIAGDLDTLLPDNLFKSWRLRRLSTALANIDGHEKLKTLAAERREAEKNLAKAYQEVITKRVWLKLAENATASIRSALMAYLAAIQKIGKGTGKRAIRYRQDARRAAADANAAVPCWIMPHYRINESLPAELGSFDLVIIDEASQSDFSALPALLRANKILVVGDDKQVSPEGVGKSEDKILGLMTRFLGNQVPNYRSLMSPENSIYDLFKAVFAQSLVMLKEHFRCVGSIIEYSKREFYNHELKPLRLPKTSERLDPPLVDIVVLDGFRKGDTNPAEARFIVDEIRRLTEIPEMANRSIGMVSLLANKQAHLVWDMLTTELGPELMARHKIACGDAKTFQGKERDIMFLSMVVSPQLKFMALGRTTFAQRFNVAASRARDRMYLVRSVELNNLSDADTLRRNMISHFSSPFAQDETQVADLRTLCESPFETEVYDLLTERGYWVTPQVKVGEFRIDMVVEGDNDKRLAIECDGDRYHGPDRWEADMRRQRVLERAGWVFWRCFASTFVRRRQEMIEDVLHALEERGIEPIGAENAPKSVHSEQRKLIALAV